MTRLLAIRLSALGDVIHAIPAVMLLRKTFDVSWVVEKPYAELVQIVAGVTPVPVKLKKWSLNRILDARQGVSGYDIAVDFQGLIKSALLTRVAAPVRFGYAKEVVREKPAAWFYNRHVTVDRTKHVVDWNVQLAEHVVATSPTPVLSRRHAAEGGGGAAWSEYARDATSKLDDLTNRIVLLPGAGRPEKQWPVERFRELVHRYHDALVVWGPGERPLAEAIGGRIAPETNLRELAFLLRHARLVVGGDTGPLHLADAVGTRVVGLYGPTDPARNGPHGQLQRTLRGADMESISAAEVTKRIDEELSR